MKPICNPYDRVKIVRQLNGGSEIDITTREDRAFHHAARKMTPYWIDEAERLRVLFQKEEAERKRLADAIHASLDLLCLVSLPAGCTEAIVLRKAIGELREAAGLQHTVGVGFAAGVKSVPAESVKG